MLCKRSSCGTAAGAGRGGSVRASALATIARRLSCIASERSEPCHAEARSTCRDLRFDGDVLHGQRFILSRGATTANRSIISSLRPPRCHLRRSRRSISRHRVTTSNHNHRVAKPRARTDCRSIRRIGTLREYLEADEEGNGGGVSVAARKAEESAERRRKVAELEAASKEAKAERKANAGGGRSESGGRTLRCSLRRRRNGKRRSRRARRRPQRCRPRGRERR